MGGYPDLKHSTNNKRTTNMEQKSRSRLSLRLLAAAGGLSAAMAMAPAMAQEGNQTQDMYVGVNPGSPGCPHIVWSVKRVGNPTAGALAGVVWYEDMSGVSVGRGQIAQDGMFTFTLASVQGAGPVGTVTGTSAAGNLDANLSGTGCSQMRVRMRAMSSVTPGSG